MIPDRITVEWLAAVGACEDHVERFRATFGDSAEIGRSNAMRAAAAGLDVDWLARRLLPPPARRAYAEAMATAWRACAEATDTAWRAYAEATAPARRACEEARAPARRAYEEATDTAWRAYAEAMATALCDVLGLPGEPPALVDGVPRAIDIATTYRPARGGVVG